MGWWADGDTRPMSDAAPRSEPSESAARIVILAGVCAALHVGKLPPAIGPLQVALGLSLVEAGFLLALVQAAGMTLGLAFGAFTDSLGPRRSMLLGLTLQAAASLAAAFAQGVPLLMATRAVEGLALLLVVLPAPGLVRALARPGRGERLLGLWGAYMPAATALAFAIGPIVMALGPQAWRGWWAGLGLLTAAMAWMLARALRDPGPGLAAATAARGLFGRLRATLGTAGPWLLALIFAVYAMQWLAVMGFLPLLVQRAGVAPAIVGLLSAAVAAVNVIGNVSAGRALQRGVAAPRLLGAGFVAMAGGAVLAFSPAPDGLRLAGLFIFSACGGLIPATLFTLATRVAPPAGGVAATTGWMQQGAAFGQFAGPPLVAWVAERSGGWQSTGAVTSACAGVGLVLSLLLARRLARRAAPPAPAAPGRYDIDPAPRLSLGRRLLIAMLAVATAITVTLMLLHPPGGVQRVRRVQAAAPEPPRCAPGQGDACLGGTTRVIVTPAPASAPAR
jgi:MFS family permease